MTNPILTELDGLSPVAKKALLDAHTAASNPIPDINQGMQAPKIPNISAPNQQPLQAPPITTQPVMGESKEDTVNHLSGPNPTAPTVTPPQQGTLQGDTLERQRLLQTGSGISQIHNPFLKGLARAGNVIGTTASYAIPNPSLRVLMTSIPGTEEHHNRLLGQNEGNIKNDLANAEGSGKVSLLGAQTRGAIANADKAEAETPYVGQEMQDTHDLRQAQIGNYQSEAYQREHPQDKFSIHDTEVGPIRVNDRTGEAQHVTVDGKPVGAKLQTIVSPPTIGDDGKPHSYLIEKNTGRKLADLGEHYERPMQVNVNAGNGALDREAKQYGTPHQKALDAGTSQMEKIEDARNMINGNAESQALGIPKVLTALVSGQGSGVRITQPELNAIAKARGFSGDFEGTINSLSGKGKLTDEQKRQLTGILDDVRKRISQKIQIHNETLDRIGSAASRDDIVKADQEARHKLSQLDSGGSINEGGTAKRRISIQKAMQLPQNKGKNEQQVRQDIESHGYEAY